MPGEWETSAEADVDATPDQVWQAIATGAGLDAWFAGSCQVEPGTGGVLHSTTAGVTDDLKVTAWEPRQRVEYRSSGGEDGRFYALNWLIEGRTGETVLRCVASGFIPGDDWEAEFEAIRDGGAMFFQSLVEYLTHFPGRAPLAIDVFGAVSGDMGRVRRSLHGGLGLDGAPRVGSQVRLSPAGLPSIQGVVYFSMPSMLAVRTTDSLFRFMNGGPMAMVGHRIFSAEPDPRQTQQAWQTWLNQTEIST